MTTIGLKHIMRVGPDPTTWYATWVPSIADAYCVSGIGSTSRPSGRQSCARQQYVGGPVRLAAWPRFQMAHHRPEANVCRARHWFRIRKQSG
jgi:hypothetical protein